MSFQKALCLICKCPTADGAVLAVHVDKDKLQTWFLNVCGNELAEEILDEDTICYFCAWQAEFLWKFDEMSDEALVWWPRNIDLDDDARELRKHFFGGEIEQCWIPLEKVKHPESEKEDCEDSMEFEGHSRKSSEKKKCIYCGKLFTLSHNLLQHVRRTHKDAIKRENPRCPTYFHTNEEREKHNEEVHEKPKEQKIFNCDFCDKEFIGNFRYTKHVRRVHRKFPVKCVFHGCVSFFKSDIEMRAHFDSLHETGKAQMIDCGYCHFKTRNKNSLQNHVARKHRKEKPFKCDTCGEMFPTKSDLSKHVQRFHTSKCCRFCKLDVSVGYFAQHVRKCICVRCKNQFQCSGLYQLHLKKCRETLLKCSKCPRSFQKHSLLVYHMKRNHGNREWLGLEHKALGFKCEPCKRYHKSAKLLKLHFKRMHNQAKLKHCAHCPKSFYLNSNLINHLAMKHNLLKLEFECDACKKQFISKSSLCKHIRTIHLK